MKLVQYGDGQVFSDALISHGFDTTCNSCGSDRVMIAKADWSGSSYQIHCTTCSHVHKRVSSLSEAMNWFMENRKKEEEE